MQITAVHDAFRTPLQEAVPPNYFVPPLMASHMRPRFAPRCKKLFLERRFYETLPYIENIGRYTLSNSTNTTNASTTMIAGSKMDIARPVAVSTSLS